VRENLPRSASPEAWSGHARAPRPYLLTPAGIRGCDHGCHVQAWAGSFQAFTTCGAPRTSQQ